MNRRTRRVAVVGGGVLGCALLSALAESGVRGVTLFERHRFGSGAAAMSGGILRCFHLDPSWSQLALESFPSLLADSRALRVATPSPVLHVLSPEQVTQAEVEFERLRGQAMSLTWLAPSQGETRFPGIFLGDAACAVLEGGAIYTDPVALCRHWVRRALANGVLAVEGSEIDVVLDGRGVCGVRTPWGVETADVVILALGGFAPPFMARLGMACPVRARAICAHVLEAASRDCPAVIDNVTGLYGRPDLPNGWLVGTPVHEGATSEDLVPHAEHREKTLAIARRRLGFLKSSRYRGARMALDAFSRDERPGLSVVPNVTGLFLLSGASGGGVKVAPQVARNAVLALKAHGAI